MTMREGWDDAPPAVAAYRAALPPGELEGLRIDALDRVAVPTYHLTYWPAHGPMNGANGYGATLDAAMTSAFGELTEVVAAHEALGRMPRRAGSYRELVEDVGPRGVLDPLTACLEAGSAYTPARPLHWVEARRLSTGEPVLVPLEWAACQTSDIGAGDWLITPITNGLGAGLSREQALCHGLLEVVQRDGNNVSFRAMDRGVLVELDGVEDATTRALLERLDRVDVDVQVKLASTDFGIPNLYVVGRDRTDGAPGVCIAPIADTACGEAADPDRERALRKALLEFAAARARKAFTHGPLDRVEEITPPGYLDPFRRGSLTDEEPRALETMRAWTRLGHAQLRALLDETVFAVRERVAFSALPTTPAGETDDAARLDFIVAWLGADGLDDILYLDYSPASGRTGVHAVKVIVPGLDVETMSYNRIGERTVRRLLDRGSPLAGVGAPPSSARCIPLTPAAERRLGGPAWLDVERVAATVGPLYPLYREPGRHSAPLAEERCAPAGSAGALPADGGERVGK